MKKPLIISGIGLIALVLLFFVVDPARVPAFVLVVPFLLLFASLFSVMLFLFDKKGMERRRGVRLAGLCAALPILLLVLQSIGQLTLRDVLTVTVLFGLSFFYIARSTVSS
ncbi:MAG TPA: hypothetical protein VF733_04610 [Candidatus Saccharimonadales bacterium]